MTYGTGLAPDREESRTQDAAERNFAAHTLGPRVLAASDTIQNIAWVRNQRAFPSCVGQAFAECIDAKRQEEPWASAVSIWREARRRQGRTERIGEGTRLEYAVAGLINRGWDPYVSGEDASTEEAGLAAAEAGDDLDDELFAHDKRMTGDLERYRVVERGADKLDIIDEALMRDFGVVIGTGLRDPFFRFRGDPLLDDEVLDTAHIGGGDNGHAMRVVGRAQHPQARSRRKYLIQNSWSSRWGGCRLPSGLWVAGCCWADETAIASCWDAHVLEVKV